MSSRGNGGNRRFIGPISGQPGPFARNPPAAPVSTYRQLPPQPASYQPPVNQIQEPLGDPGYSGGALSGADVRRALKGYEDKLQASLNEINALAGDVDQVNRKVDELFQLKNHPGLSGTDLGALSGELRAAVASGRCIPYMLGTSVLFEAGVVGDRRFGGIVLTTDGPFFISKLLAYAQIDDERASQFPFSLIDPPLCDADAVCPFPAGSGNRGSSFTASTNTLIPQIDANGMFVPVSPQNCKLIMSGSEIVCYTQECVDGAGNTTTRNFAGRVPITILDHVECVDGITEITLNGCQFDNVPFPLAFWEDAAFDVAGDAPDCIGVCGFLDCQKELDIALTLTRALRYQVNVMFVLAGFRVLTCGPGFCGPGQVT